VLILIHAASPRVAVRDGDAGGAPTFRLRIVLLPD
jgi:hypothetical protein